MTLIFSYITNGIQIEIMNLRNKMNSNISLKNGGINYVTSI